MPQLDADTPCIAHVNNALIRTVGFSSSLAIECLFYKFAIINTGSNAIDNFFIRFYCLVDKIICGFDRIEASVSPVATVKKKRPPLRFSHALEQFIIGLADMPAKRVAAAPLLRSEIDFVPLIIFTADEDETCIVTRRKAFAPSSRVHRPPSGRPAGTRNWPRL